VHDLRVATRRFIAILDMVTTVLPDDRLAEARRGLKKELNALNELRDIQVQIKTVTRLLPTYRVLRPFLLALRREERRLVKRGEKMMTRLNIGLVEQRVAESTTSLLALFAEPHMENSGRAVVTGNVAAAFARAVMLRHDLNVNDPRTIHKLRVAFKKFRYMAEAARLMTPRQLKAMNAYQTRMGDVQDKDVLCRSVRSFALRPARVPAVSFLPLHQYLARERQAAIESFVKGVDELFAFRVPS
jgi:CHAD domain-containing protein